MLMSLEGAQEGVESAKASLNKELEALNVNVKEIEGTLTDLKVKLYAKFGDNINLEAGE